MNYVRIDFKNCNTDYEYTIAPTWSDAMEYVQDREGDFMLINQEKSPVPEVKLSLVNMTADEYEKWFKKNVKP